MVVLILVFVIFIVLIVFFRGEGDRYAGSNKGKSSMKLTDKNYFL